MKGNSSIGATTAAAIKSAFNRSRPVELVREYIQDSLYNPYYGYFATKVNILPIMPASSDQLGDIEFSVERSEKRQLNSLPSLFPSFSSLKGYSEYQSCLQRFYGYERYVEYTESNKFTNQWHTPSTIFFPYYGEAIAKCILHQMERLNLAKLHIIEIGPGNGALCASILNYVKRVRRDLFEECRYDLVEISPKLHELQQSFLAGSDDRVKVSQNGVGNSLFDGDLGERCVFHNKSFADLQPPVVSQSEHTFVLAFEVLDNLPHDKIMYSSADGDLLECFVETDDHSTYSSSNYNGYREIYQRAADKLVIDLVVAFDAVGYKSPSLRFNLTDMFYQALPLFIKHLTYKHGGMDAVNPWRTEFIPTGAFGIIRQIIERFPHHTLIASDFDYLPDSIAGYGGPLVQTNLRGDTVSVSSYLVKRGYFDMMFATNFSLLKLLYQYLCSSSGVCTGEIFTHYQMMMKWCDFESVRLRDGYNPLLDEYSNVKFFVGTFSRNKG